MMIQQLVDWFEKHPEISIIGFFLGIILGIWSLVITIRSKNNKSLALSLDGNNLIQDFSEKLNGLEINFKEEKVKNLTITKIAIWNAGNLTIHKKDIVDGDRLRVSAEEDVNILDFQIIQTNEDSNKITLIDSGYENMFLKTIDIDFDYLDSQQGFVLQIIHNGNAYNDITVKGKLKGIQKFKILESNRFINKFSTFVKFSKNKQINRIISGIFFLIMAATLPFLLFYINKHEKSSDESLKYFLVILSLPYLYIGLRLLFRKFPKGLDTFNDKI